MLVSHRKNFIYTKTYKTASTSIELLFERYCVPEEDWTPSHQRKEQVTEAGIVGCRGYDPKQATWYNHMPAAEIRAQVERDIWESYYKFCSIRNPFDKAVSMYNDVRSSSGFGYINGKIRGKLASLSRKTLQLDFERFVHTFTTDRDKYIVNRDFCLDHVIFFEHLKEDVSKVVNYIDLNCGISDLPSLKTGKRLNNYETHEYFNEKSKKYIEDEFSLEISKFGYSFPNSQGSSKPSEKARKKFTPSK